ncbi:diaminopimelate decarboxylase [Streptomyces sporangiiformans]|uniref:diaminopimelate decarboxylase n=1 Tax=Streptomyces sporangiiformans TaxID=2315329 RepID=UPI001F09569E|nr:diaminopimelate decarboxylase [Streptomyces sporangiiformans]
MRIAQVDQDTDGRRQQRDRAVREAVRSGLIGPAHVAAGFLDADGIQESVRDLQRAFGDAPVLHTFAAKAAPLVPVLRLLARSGMGCEVASPGELAQAVAADFPPERIVLDSPAKTRAELADALALGVAVNADNFPELDRIGELLAVSESTSVLGLRINPQVGAGAIDAMSTASLSSKFGVPLRDAGARKRILKAFAERPWLTRLHVHVGSQGCSLELIGRGVRAAYELAEEINAMAGRQQVTSLDIGGGLPVNFDDDEIRPTYADYVRQLRASVPELLGGRYDLVTEFGRSLVAKNGFTAAVVEYTKDAGGRRIALTHAGAHIATRTVFMPEAWPLRIAVYDSDGKPKLAPERVQDVAGPCCFAGDLVARGRKLPELAPGDVVVLLDTGGYYFSSPWSYNSLARPAVHGFTTRESDIRFAAVRPEQTLVEILAESGVDQADALLFSDVDSTPAHAGTPAPARCVQTEARSWH